MSMLDLSTGDKFVVRIIKNLVSNPFNKWSNSYEVKIFAAIEAADLLAECMSLFRLEKAISKDVVQFDHMIISTWEPDSVPYDPTSFLVQSLTGLGDVGPVGDNLALNQCLVVVRQPLFGRFGHLFYRGALNEADTEAPAGKLVLADPEGTADTFASAVTSSGVSGLLGTTPDNDVGLVMISADGTQVRSVISLNATGATTLPTDHAWFNRTPA